VVPFFCQVALHLLQEYVFCSDFGITPPVFPAFSPVQQQR
jgi:hypothetical protein